jgi:hypothetical protein
MKMQGAITVPWFTAETWPELLAVATDRATLPDTFAEFEVIAGRKFARFTAQGHSLHKVLISVAELTVWCRANRIPIDGHGRAAFAAFVAMRRDRAH